MSESSLLKLCGHPVYQNKMYATASAAMLSPRGDLALSQSLESGLVRNLVFDPSQVSYDEAYQNEQICSPAFVAHLNGVLDVGGRHFGSRPIVEVGCGKRAFVSMLRERGHDVTGMDPAYEGDDPSIRKQMFDQRSNFGADAVVLRHVLEHLCEPFLAGSGVEVFSPKRAQSSLECADILVMNSNYLEEISISDGNRHRYIAVDNL